MHDKYKDLVKGIEYAHSLSWNPHKMLNVPLSLSAFLVRDKVNLYKTMSTEADYLFQTESDYYNHGTKYLQCGRPNNTLKFWCARKYLGHKGYAQRVQKQFDLANYTVNRIRKETSLELLMDPPFLNICFSIQ
jgi:sulfinoalanine decarboxylase/sulfinoalanine decarboxylase/aspartate 1-decarboxylase